MRDLLSKGGRPLASPAACVFVFVAVVLFSHAGSGSATTRHGGSASNIYVADTRTGSVRKVTNNLEVAEDQLAYSPSWSPDGRHLVFTETPCHYCATEIRVVTIGAKKSLGRRIGLGFHPSWSPDGRSIAFVAPSGALYVMTSTGAHRRLLVEGGFANDNPTWSPDGKSIAFARHESATTWQIYSIGFGGHGLRQLTSRPGQNVTPSWAPDGRRIAFSRQNQGGLWQIYVMNADGTGARSVGDGKGSDSAPRWAPDESALAFVREVGLNGSRVYVLTLGTRRVRAISPPSLDAVEPSWAPRGPLVAFAARERN